MPKTREEIDQETEHARERLHKALSTAQSGVWARMDVGRGETDYVHLYVVDAAGQLMDITYWAVRATGAVTSVERGWPMRGGQYNKREHAASAAYRAAGLPYSQAEHFSEFR